MSKNLSEIAREEAQELLDNIDKWTFVTLRVRANALAKTVIQLTEPEPGVIPKAPLSERQQAVHDFMLQMQEENGMPPTVREIGRHFNIKSPNGVMCHIRSLERKGVLEIKPEIARGHRALPIQK